MKDKKLILALIALVAVVGILLGIYFATRPQPNDGNTDDGTVSGTDGSTQSGKSFTVEVTYPDGSKKTFEYVTQEAYLGPALVAAGLIEEAASPGMYDTVDGVKADYSVDQSWWAFYIGDEMAMVGMDETLVNDGDVFALVYTK